jgi:hypothetical protein
VYGTVEGGNLILVRLLTNSSQVLLSRDDLVDVSYIIPSWPAFLSPLQGGHKTLVWSEWKISPSKRFVLVKADPIRVRAIFARIRHGLVLKFLGPWVTEVSPFKTWELLRLRFSNKRDAPVDSANRPSPHSSCRVGAN